MVGESKKMSMMQQSEFAPIYPEMKKGLELISRVEIAQFSGK
jgi:hypothetical protein